MYLPNARGRLRTFHMYREFAVKEEEFYPEMYVCMYYVWRSMVELTHSAHLECSAYCRIRQAAMSLVLFSVSQ